MSKGSSQRPLEVLADKFRENWDRTFHSKSGRFMDHRKDEDKTPRPNIQLTHDDG